MTCIVAIADGGNVYMGGDSAITGDHDIETQRWPKVFKFGECLIGCCGYPRMRQILEYHVTLKPRHGGDPLKWLVVDVIPDVRAQFKEHGFLEKDKEAESGGFFLVAVGGRIFEIQSNFQVLETAESYLALGSGRRYAVGAMEVLVKGKLSPRAKIKNALAVAAKYTSSVRGPFTILSIKGDEPEEG